jgi:nucleotide-binding universal stress UspA family protein
MLRTILAGLDGTPASRGVLDLGIRWARRFDALLVGIATIDEPGLHGPEEWVLGETHYKHGVNQHLLHDLTRRIEQILSSAALTCAHEGVAFKPLEEVGDPYIEILRESQRYDLILLGLKTHFEFGFENIEDETLIRVLRSAPRPVVVVPEIVNAGETVMIAYDGSLQASRALYAFEASGLGRGRDVHVVSVASEHSLAAAQADRVVDFLAYHEIKSVPIVVTSSDSPARVLLERARALGAGLIVMGVYGQPILREFFVGSTTRTMLRETPVPLFVSH